MIDLINIFNGINIKVETQKELDKLTNYVNKLGYKWKTGSDRIIIANVDFPIVVKFKNYIMTWHNCNSDNYGYNFKFSDIFVSLDIMTAREFLEKFIKHLNCGGRICEECKFSCSNNSTHKNICEPGNWEKDNIDYLIELVFDDDPIYHPPMDNIRAANFIDDVLGGKELSKEEEEALKYAAEKLREKRYDI